MPKVFVDKSNVFENHIEITNQSDIHHLVNVLRLKIGDELEVSDNDKFNYRGQISAIGNGKITLKIVDIWNVFDPLMISIDLYQGLPKADKMDFIVQKSVELGVHSIFPVWMDRTIIKKGDGFLNKWQRWQKISEAASRQSRRFQEAKVETSLLFSDALNLAREKKSLILFPYEKEKDFSIKTFFRSLAKRPTSIAIFIGPEGGFSENEKEQLINCGAQPLSLGKNILRTETAAIVSIAMLVYEFEL